MEISHKYRNSPKQRIVLNSTVLPSGCWRWNLRLTGAGYGTVKINRKQISAHRYCYLLYNGEIPEGMQANHTCHNKWCVNPKHLKLGTPSTNAKDGKKAPNYQGSNLAKYQENKTHCPQGHPYNAENTSIYRGWRSCKVCRRDRERVRRQKEG